MIIVGLLIASIPVAVSVWALLDAARRPAWAWAFAGRSQLAWLTAIVFTLFLPVVGLAVAAWYLVRLRTAIAAVEGGDLGSIDVPGRGG